MRRTDKPKPRTDVVKRRSDGAEGRFKVVDIDGDDEREYRKKRSVENEIIHDLSENRFGELLPLEAERQNAIRVDTGSNLANKHFAVNRHTADFKTSRR